MAIKGLRPIRVARFIQRELASTLLHKARNPLLKEVVITHVRTSPDLHEATVYYRILGKENTEPYQKALTHSAQYLQKMIGPSLHMAWIPKLTFRYDKMQDEADRLEDLFKSINNDGDEFHV